jgi:hypothetical protein
VPLTAYPLCVTRYADLGAGYDRCVGLSSAIANLLVLRFAESLIEGITRATPAEDSAEDEWARQSLGLFMRTNAVASSESARYSLAALDSFSTNGFCSSGSWGRVRA